MHGCSGEGSVFKCIHYNNIMYTPGGHPRILRKSLEQLPVSHHIKQLGFIFDQQLPKTRVGLPPPPTFIIPRAMRSKG